MTGTAVRKAVNVFGNVLFVVFIVILIIVAGFMVKGKLDGGVPSVGPYKLYVVLSGSMNPVFNTGSIIAVNDVDAASVAEGDIITFKNPADESMIVTHRVVEVEEENGELVFITKGDANDAKDADPVPAANLLGREQMDIPYVGYVAEFAKTQKGLLFLIVIPGSLILLSEIRNLIRYAGEMEEEEKRKKLQTAEAESRV